MNKPVSKQLEAFGVKGMQSKSWRKKFKTLKAYETWYEKNEGNVEVYGLREVE